MITNVFPMLEIRDTDIFGEDRLLYDRDNSYSVKVLSKEAVLYQICIKEFQRSFPKVLPHLK